MPASLTLQLKKLKEEDFFKRLRHLSKKNQIEFCQTAAFHPLLPRLPEKEIIRQIILNREINECLIGKDFYRPRGFFPPEMAYSNQLKRVLIDLGVEYVVLDQHSSPLGVKNEPYELLFYTNKHTDTKNNNVYKKVSDTKNIPNKNLGIFFRDENLSIKIAYSDIKSIDEFNLELNKYYRKADQYIVMAMDGETFGHHQPGQDDLLFDILNNRKKYFVFVSEIEKYIRIKREIEPRISSWAVSDANMRKKIYWPEWSYPGNKIHSLQWGLTRLAFINGGDKVNQWKTSQALHSDQYWWASNRPYWNPGMVKKGAWMLYESIRSNKVNTKIIKNRAKRIYQQVIDLVGGEEERVEFLPRP